MLSRKVEKHKHGWAAVEVSAAHGKTSKTVLQVYPTKAAAEAHWNNEKERT